MKISLFLGSTSTSTCLPLGGFLGGMKSIRNPFRELSVGHVDMALNFSPVVKVALSFALFCILQTTGLPNSLPPPHPFHNSYPHHHNVTQYPHLHPHLTLYPQTDSDPLLQDEPFRLDPTSEDDTYDPVEAYHQLRRHYLTSTSRVDRVHYGIGGWDSSSSYGRTRHHSHIQNNYHHPQQPKPPHNYQDSGGSSSSGGSSDRDNNRNSNGRTYGQIKAGESAAHSHFQQPEPYQTQHFILNQQRCYVCLPPNKGSREAKDILAMFGKEDPKDIADCAEFTQANAKGYAFNCPPGFGGCILRIHGLNVSRACSKYRLNDCKKANSVEFCYCTEPLCNDVKPAPVPLYTSGEEDDDEDNGGGSGERSTKEEETPSDSELLHTPNSSGGGGNSKNKAKDSSSVALANFNDNGNHGGEDVSGLTDGDLNVGSSCSSRRNPPTLLLSPVLSLSLFWWVVVVCQTWWWTVMFMTPISGESSGNVKSVRAKTTLHFS